MVGGRTIRQKPLVLLVEDEPIILEVVQVVLEESGFAVVAALDGHQALAMLDGHGADFDGLVTTSACLRGPMAGKSPAPRGGSRRFRCST